MLQSAAIGGAIKSKYTDLKKKQRVGMLKNAAIVGAMNSKYPDFFLKKITHSVLECSRALQ